MGPLAPTFGERMGWRCVGCSWEGAQALHMLAQPAVEADVAPCAMPEEVPAAPAAPVVLPQASQGEPLDPKQVAADAMAGGKSLVACDCG